MKLLLAATELDVATRAAEQLAGKSDRVLFLLVTLLLVGGLVVLVKYFVRRSEGYAEKLEKIVEAQNATQRELAVCLDRNTAVMKRCVERLEA